MGRSHLRLVSCLLILSLVFSFVTSGCKTKKFVDARDPEYVEDDGEPWYVAETVDCEIPETESDYFTLLDVGSYDGNIYAVFQAIDYFYSNCLLYLVSYDINGSIISMTNLVTDIDADTDMFNVNLLNSDFDDGNIYLEYESYDYYSPEERFYCYSLNEDDLYLIDSVDRADYTIQYACVFDSVDHYWMAEYSYEEGSLYVNEVQDSSIVDIINMSINLSDDRVISKEGFIYSYNQYLCFTTSPSDSEDYIYYDYSDQMAYDVYTQDIVPASQIFQFPISEYEINGVTYSISKDGILKGTDGEKELYVPFDHCDVDLNEVLYSSIVDVSDDTISLVSYGNYNFEDRITITNLHKYDKNPHVGKEVINVSYIGILACGKNIVDYNMNNDKYFIKLDRRFENFGVFSEDEEYNYDEWYAGSIDHVISECSSKDSPDIVLDVCNSSRLANSDLFEDLNFKVEGTFSEDEYLLNIISNCKTSDGRLTVLPMNFRVTGLSMDFNLVDGNGIDLVSYEKIVTSEFKGTDPMNFNMDKTGYFFYCYENEAQDFYDKNGNFNADNETFRELAQYVKKNVPDYFDSSYSYGFGSYDTLDWEEYDYYSNMVNYVEDCITYLNVVNYGGFIERKLVGAPTSKAYSPRVIITTSASICKNAGSKEGCWEFIKYLCGDEAQSAMNGYGISINLNVDFKNADNFIEQFNSSKMTSSYYFSVLVNRGVTEIEPEKTEDYIDFLRSLKHIEFFDYEYEEVIEKELIKYFNDECDLDTCIASINAQLS